MAISKYVIPILVIVALLGGFFLRTVFTQPTTDISYGSDEGVRLECVVEGIRCKGTAEFFSSMYEGIPGINGILTYASEHKAVFTYDPELITPDSIKAVMEVPIMLNDGSKHQFYRCVSME